MNPPGTLAGAEARAGAVAACSAYLLWGLAPLYWTQLHGIPALELIAHRFVWSLVVLLALTTKLGNSAPSGPPAEPAARWGLTCSRRFS